MNRTTKYALRALVGLAGVAGEGRILGHDLAENIGVPGNYLSKILLTLKKAGMVEATRGLGGGYRLSRPASEMCLIEVVTLFEGPQEPGMCLLNEGVACSEGQPCSAHRAWDDIHQAYLRFLKDTRLRDLANPPQGVSGVQS